VLLSVVVVKPALEKGMRISELSRVTGVPVPTVKYYLREGLLPRGTSTAPNQAEYGQGHVRRLRHIRVLRDVGDLGIAQVRSVLEAMDREDLPLHQVLGVAHHALGPPPDPGSLPDEVARARADVDRFLARLRWRVSREAPARRTLADALVALRKLGSKDGVEVFRPYAEAADRIASWELSRAPSGASPAENVEWLVVGTVVFETALAALRRLAQEHHSALRFGGRAGRRRRRPGSRTDTAFA
jgi:DNA-binding transcriptional MerR regulator